MSIRTITELLESDFKDNTSKAISSGNNQNIQ